MRLLNWRWLSAAALLAIVVVAIVSVAGDKRSEARAAPGACGPPAPAPSTPPVDVKTATHPDGSSERTEFYGGGVYRVSRCGPNGEFRISMTVGPITEPGGGQVNVPLSVVEFKNGQFTGAAASYADASDPDFAHLWKESGDATKASVIPPTGGAP